MEEITYKDIEIGLAEYFGIRKNIIVPNCFISFGTAKDHECDLIVIQKNGYAAEVEIKMTVSDFKADFKKKHCHEHELLRYLYYAMPSDIYDSVKNDIPDNCGAFSIEKVFRNEEFVTVTSLKLSPTAKPSRKLNFEEQLKIARLGTMRLWKHKGELNNHKTKIL